MSSGEQALLDGAGAVAIARTVVTVTGPDAVSFLQGQLSQDVEAIAVGSSALSFLLHPQGKVVAVLRVSRLTEESVLLDTDDGLVDEVVTRLQRFKLRVKADIEVPPWRCVSVRGPEAPRILAALHAVPDITILASDWPSWPGADALGESPAMPPGVTECTPADYEVARIIQGIPRSGVEIDERTIPAETGLVERAVSFTKGCYTGQELVARIDSRGHVNRHLRRLSMPGGAGNVPPAGAVLRRDGKDVGVVTSAAYSVTGCRVVALGYVRREVEPGDAVDLDGTAVLVEP